MNNHELTNNKMLSVAMMIVTREFVDGIDKGGQPYALHCMRVADYVKHYGVVFQVVGWLHDLLEDKSDEWNPDRLRGCGFTSEVVDAVVALTKVDGQTNEQYLDIVAANRIARIVKREGDLRDNMDVTRLKGLRKKDMDRLAKYARSYEFLKD